MKKDLPVVGRHRRAEAKVEFGSRVGLSDKLRGLKDGIGSRHQRDNSTLAIKEIQFRTSSGPTSQKAVYAMRPDGSQHQARERVMKGLKAVVVLLNEGVVPDLNVVVAEL